MMDQTANALPRGQSAPDLQHDMANAIRALAMDAVEKAQSGHPGMPMGMADVATILFSRFMKFDPANPHWPDRDRFVLSAGHGSMLLYAILHLLGTEDMTIDALKAFRQFGSATAGHPEYGHAAGIEMTTGPLGQGIASAVGMALGERMMNARLGDEIIDHYTYVIAGDGCLMEGISHEAIDFAGHLRLSKLIVLFDDNRISIDGETSLATSTDQLKRFEAAGWSTRRVDGHDHEAVTSAISEERESNRPSLIACRTIIGFGAPHKQGTAATHGSPLGADEVAAARGQLGWTAAPFEVPKAVRDSWRAVANFGHTEHEAWLARCNGAPIEARRSFAELRSAGVTGDLDDVIDDLKRSFSEHLPELATRQSSQKVLEAVAPILPQLIGGSADLTGSNGTRVRSQDAIGAARFGGNYIHYGVREHGMAAIMNGLALHGGFIPYGGTFLAFADYSRPAIRLAALMGVRVIHVMTHDSIGLGEDGPTHQPVEHLAALRAMPNLNVFRPADAVETAEAWLCALKAEAAPSLLALSRQGLPTFRTEHTDNNLVAFGAYVVREPEGARDVTLIASGSEVAIVRDAADRLGEKGVRAAIVSMPCMELFRAQPHDYRQEVLGPAPRIAVEAAVRDSWDRWIGPDGGFIGMTGFGASAPADVLYRHFGITADAVCSAAEDLIGAGAQTQ